MLEGLFGEYHSPSATVCQQRPEATKQPLLMTGWPLLNRCGVNRRFAQNREKSLMQEAEIVTNTPKSRPKPVFISTFLSFFLFR